MNKTREREQRILAFMKNEIHAKGYPPTVREICNALEIKSTSTVHKDIANLEKQGFLKKDPSKPRALMLVENEEPERKVVSSAPAAYGSTSPADIVDVPVIGRVAAGTPILAEQNIEDSFPVPARFVNGGTNFMLTVHGESMIEAGIMDGDYILVEQQNTARNGDIVCALVDDSATIKTFYKEADHFRLQPQNSSMDPIIVKDCKILGKVIGLLRMDM